MPAVKKKEEKEEVKVLEITRFGSKLVVPEDATWDEAIESLQRKAQEEESTISFSEAIECFQWDGALALALAMEELFGYSVSKPIMTWFGPIYPKMIAVRTSLTETVNVPWGRFTLPGVDGYVETAAGEENGRYMFYIHAQVKKKNEAKVKALGKRTREIVKERSIYRGKAFSMKYIEKIDDNTGSKYKLPVVEFLDLRRVMEKPLIFSNSVNLAVEHNLFTPVERTEDCRKHHIPLKRGVLLAGPYGTGKTLAAMHTAYKCEENNWTFIYCSKTQELPEAIRFAAQYAPSVVFCEDVDRVASGGRTNSLDNILNTIDGVDTKNSEVVIVLTTNHLEDINPAMLRPGRIDALIEVKPPDAEAVQRLLHLYGRGLIPKDADLSAVGKELDGEIPAVIGEVCEKAKLAAIAMSPPGSDMVITADALLAAAISMQPQRAALKAASEGDNNITGQSVDILSNAIVKSVETLGAKNGKAKAATPA